MEYRSASKQESKTRLSALISQQKKEDELFIKSVQSSKSREHAKKRKVSTTDENSTRKVEVLLDPVEVFPATSNRDIIPASRDLNDLLDNLSK